MTKDHQIKVARPYRALIKSLYDYSLYKENCNYTNFRNFVLTETKGFKSPADGGLADLVFLNITSKSLDQIELLGNLNISDCEISKLHISDYAEVMEGRSWITSQPDHNGEFHRLDLKSDLLYESKLLSGCIFSNKFYLFDRVSVNEFKVTMNSNAKILQNQDVIAATSWEITYLDATNLRGKAKIYKLVINLKNMQVASGSPVVMSLDDIIDEITRNSINRQVDIDKDDELER